MTKRLQIALAGAGLIGKRHIEAAAEVKNVNIVAIVDPKCQSKEYATNLGVKHFKSLGDMLRRNKPDGVILATPNLMHVENGLECIEARCPILVEKPISTTSKDAEALVKLAKKYNIPILVGHHRRYNPLIKRAHQIINSGKLGKIRAISSTCWLYKPDEYFTAAPWRQKIGAGPISVNLAHDIDLLIHLCGDIQSVQGQETKSLRGYENEDVAAAILKFTNGAIGTISVSDTVVAPWSWELTSKENPIYPHTKESCYFIGGTNASLSLPDLTLWNNNGLRSWWQDLEKISLNIIPSDPLVMQINHFANVIQNKEEPLVSGEEGLKTLYVLEAIQESIKSGAIKNLL